MTTRGKTLELDRIFPSGEARQAFAEGYAAGLGAALVKQLRRHGGVEEASELARRLGVSPPRISAVESGRGRDGPSLGLLLRVAEACGLSLRLEAVRRADGAHLSIPLVGEPEEEEGDEQPTAVRLEPDEARDYLVRAAGTAESAGPEAWLVPELDSLVIRAVGGEHEREAPEVRTAAQAVPRSVTASMPEVRRVADVQKPRPAVPVSRSVTADYLICLEDGRKLKALKRYLRVAYGMSPEEYRAKWGLPADYPMVAPGYAGEKSGHALRSFRKGSGAPARRRGEVEEK